MPTCPTRTAPARWPGRHATRERLSYTHTAATTRAGSLLATTSTSLCRLKCCVPTMAHSTNQSTKTHHTPQSSQSLARFRIRARGLMRDITLQPSYTHAQHPTGHSWPALHLGQHCAHNHSAGCHTLPHACTPATHRETTRTQPHTRVHSPPHCPHAAHHARKASAMPRRATHLSFSAHGLCVAFCYETQV